MTNEFYLFMSKLRRKQWIEIFFLMKSDASDTSNLMKHGCYIKAKSPTPYTSETSPPKKAKIDDCMKQSVTDGVLQFVAEDGKAFCSVKGTGFKKMAEHFVEIGQQLKEGEFNIEDLISDATTISRNLKKVQKENLTDFMAKMKPIVDRGKCHQPKTV